MRALPLLLLAALGASACASTQVRGRDVTRLGPLRDEPVRPASAERAVLLEAGAYVLDDEEHERMRELLGAHFVDRVAAERDERARGTARMQRCRLRATPTPRHTVYLARCRVALVIDDVAVVEVEASAERKTRARAVSEKEAERIQKLTRNPLLSFEDSQRALQSALDAAVELLVTGVPPAALEGEEAAVFDGPLMRQHALARLERDTGPALAAAAIDLGRWGTAADGAALVPHLDDDDALVRRASATSLGELGARSAHAALEERRGDPDRQVQEAVELALARLEALYPDLPRSSSRSAPSNRSTVGGAE